MIKGMDDSSNLPKDIQDWIAHNITRPIKGFEHKKKGNGTFCNYDEQIKATHEQVSIIALCYLNQGKSTEEVLNRLNWFA